MCFERDGVGFRLHAQLNNLEPLHLRISLKHSKHDELYEDSRGRDALHQRRCLQKNVKDWYFLALFFAFPLTTNNLYLGRSKYIWRLHRVSITYNASFPFMCFPVKSE
jgi:hypothetical protein